jgi:hypothetical protein
LTRDSLANLFQNMIKNRDAAIKADQEHSVTYYLGVISGFLRAADALEYDTAGFFAPSVLKNEED